MNQPLDPIYQEMILDLYRHPLNKKALKIYDAKRREFNPACGDDIEIMIKFTADGRIEDIGHQGVGCVISQVSASLLTDYVKGKTKKEILKIDDKKMLELLGISVTYTRLKCALLGLKAIQKSLFK